MKKLTLFLFASMLILSIGSVVKPETRKWTGNNSSDWNDVGNWDTAVPSGTDKVEIPSGQPNYPIITASIATYSGNTTVKSGASITINSGDFNTTGNVQIDGSMTMNGGTLSAKDFKGIGTFTMSGGLLQVSHDYKPTTPANFNCSGGGTVEFTGNPGAGAFGTTGTYKFNNVIVDAAVTKGPGFDKNANNIISISGNLNIKTPGIVDLPNNSSTTTNSLQFDSVYQAAGTWGGSSSAATNTNDNYFLSTSTGLITVSVLLPVELTSFSAKILNNSVELQWQTQTEVNNHGFDVERKVKTGKSWEKIGFVAGNGNSNSPKNYSYTDKNLVGGSEFAYRLKQVDNDGTFTYSDALEVTLVPDKFELFQNYPNPFNPSTKIRYSIPTETDVVIRVYDILGKEIRTLINEEKPMGNYEVEFDGSDLSSGVYFYKIQAGDFVVTKRLVLMK